MDYKLLNTDLNGYIISNWMITMYIFNSIGLFFVLL